MKFVNAQSYLDQHLGKQNTVEVKLTLPPKYPAEGKVHYLLSPCTWCEDQTALFPGVSGPEVNFQASFHK